MNRIPGIPIAIVAMVSGLTACNAPVGVDPALPSAQRDQLQRAMARPPIDPNASYESASVNIELPVPLAAFRAWFATNGAPKLGSYLTGTAAVPGVARTEPLTGTWQQAGDRRRVVMNDGHTLVEEVIESGPNHFSYLGWNSTNKTGRYTRYSIGEFVFTGDAQRTQLEWTSKFRPKVWPDGPLIRSSIEQDYRNYMRVGLSSMRKQALAELAQK
ncbi:MAG: SRPBCC family protein [Pseudomonadota bacterium]